MIQAKKLSALHTMSAADTSSANCLKLYLVCFTSPNKLRQIITILLILVGYKAVVHLIIWNLGDDDGPPVQVNVNGTFLEPSPPHRLGSQGCIIPSTRVIPEFFKGSWSISLSPNCSYEQLLARIKDDQEEVVLEPSFVHSNCCIQEIIAQKSKSSSLHYRLTPCFKVDSHTGSAHVSKKEALLIRCNNSINLEFNIPMKKSIRGKLNYWEKIPLRDRPVSVLLLGVDSVSRAHAYRSLPKTMNYMNKIGFTDFKNYHSIAPSTLTNFVAFLSGMTRPQVRLTCAPDWNTPFDKCPLIWKNFSQHNYITSYMEDWGQTFSWGGQAGFSESPTDYYLHHPFLILRRLRQQQRLLLQGASKPNKAGANVSLAHNIHESQQFAEDPLDCTSDEAIPQFILRYFLRFSRKFSKFPFFSFTWINNPFHDENRALSQYDDHFLEFFKSLSSTKLFNRLLIIFLSDHGDRTGFFHTNRKSIESFIERGLPPLFIRVPDQFRIKYPHLVSSLVNNSNKLTTPFDVHHTLLHVISSGQNQGPEAQSVSNPSTHGSSSDIFKSTLTDRASIFSTFPENRTCDQTNIPPTNCLCNIKLTENDSQTEISYKVLEKISMFAIEELNFKINSSNYSNVCAKWTAMVILYVKKIAESHDHFQYILAFAAQPGAGKFEARIVVFLNPASGSSPSKVLEMNRVKGLKLLGVSRINKYGDQSLCVNDRTDLDKEIKEFCMCKSYLDGLKL